MKHPKPVANGVIMFGGMVLLAIIYICPFESLVPFLGVGAVLLFVALALGYLR